MRQSIFRRLGVVAIVLSLLLGISSGAWAQKVDAGKNYDLSLSVKSATVNTFTEAFTQKTGVLFSYEAGLAQKPMGDITVNVKGATLTSILDDIFEKQVSGFKYKLMSSTVVITADVQQVTKSQKITVSGKVTDSNGEPMIGAGVLIKGTAKGVNTDLNGNYTIEVSPTAELVFSYLGYKDQEEKVMNRSILNVTFSEGANVLEDVVVVGYGTQSRKSLTTSISKVDGSKLYSAPVSNIGDALKGKVTGLRVATNNTISGNAPRFLIRGGSSISLSNDPVVIVDGVTRDMDDLNPNDIESIEVLKDAASAGIYGARASNGVILVTTKRGAQGKIKVSFNGYVGFNKATTMPEQTSAVEYMQAVDHARANNNMEPLYTNAIQAYLNGEVDQINYYDTDWRSEVLDGNGMVQNYSVSASGGTENLSVYASAGYYKQNGLISNNTFDRTTLRLNSDMKVNSWMKLGVDVSVRQATVTSPVMATPSEIIGKAYTMTPIMSGINADGSWGYGINGTNPIAMSHLDECVSHSVAPEYIVTPKVVITPFKGLTIEGRYTWKRNDAETSAFVRPYETFENGAYKGPFPTTGSSRSEARSKQVFKQYNLMGTYENTFAKH